MAIGERPPAARQGPAANRRGLSAWARVALAGLGLGLLVLTVAAAAFALARPKLGAFVLISGMAGALAGIGVAGLLQLRSLRRSDAALREQLAMAGSRLRLAAVAARVASWEWDPTRDRIVWSPELEDLYGLDRGRGPATEAGFLALLHPEDRDRVRADLARAVAGEDYETEFRIRLPGGQERWIAAKGGQQRSGSDRRLAGINFDITERKRAEAAQQRLAERLLAAEEGGGTLVYDYDVASGRVQRGDGLTRLLGWGRDEVPATAEGWNALIHPDDRARIASLAPDDVVGPDGRCSLEYRVRHKDGRWIWLWDRGRAERDDTGRVARIVGSATDINERKQAETALARGRAQLHQAAAAARLTYAEADLVAGRMSWGENYAEVMGFALPGGPEGGDLAACRAAFLAHVAEADRDAVGAALRAFHAGEAIGPVDYRLLGDDGRERWIETRWTMAPGEDGNPARTFSTSLDITARKRSEEHIRLLMDEVNHRAKNLLAVVQSIARLTIRDSPPQAFARNLVDRLQSLGASQDLIVRSGWQGVDLAGLVRAQLDHLGPALDRQVSIGGPRLWLPPAAAQGIGMALHELATNALKHGSLSSGAGRVEIAWTIGASADSRFAMSWVERGGPPVPPPGRRGFGHTVIERMAAQSVGGTVDLRFDPAGLRWRLEAPADRLLRSMPASREAAADLISP
jgi:PAS domain S-box-containing protein